MPLRRLLLLLLIVLAAGAYFAFDLGRFLGLDYFRSQQGVIAAWQTEHPVQAALIFLAIYVTATGLSLPGATILTLAAGALFGLVWGTVLVSFASTAGATLAFLASRFLLRDWVRARFGDRLRAFDAGIAREGAFYLFTLRLVPAFPFFMINLLMGLTPIRTWTYAWVSQLGMLAGTIVYVNAGTQLGAISSIQGILSPALLASFILLGLFPLLAKKLAEAASARRVYVGWTRPKRFDRNLIVIGGGSAGLVTAYIAAAVKAKVTLVEQHKLGGDCLNTGCVPSKALISSARLLAQIRRANEWGIRDAHAEFDFAEVMDRVRRVVTAIEPHDSAARYASLGVEVLAGSARIVSPWEVEVRRADGRSEKLTTRAIVIATGARPLVPAIPGIEDVDALTSDNLWSLRTLPRRLLVLGGGPIGCELAQAFARLGSAVTQVEMAPRILMREDVDVADRVARQFRAEGIDLRPGHRAKQFVVENGERILIAESDGKDLRIPFDVVVVAVGRAARLEGFGLEELGIETDRTIRTNEFLQTKYPNILAAGDVVGPYQFTHVAAHQAWYAAVNALFSPLRTFRADYSVIPWATFIEPEVARVGLNELEAAERGTPYESTLFDLEDLDRAIADCEARGFVKVLTVPGRDKILGVTIVGAHAAELLAEFVLAMRHGLGLEKILGTIHIYPTLAEANKFAAGAWKKAHAPQGLLEWVRRFHTWRRG